MRTPIVRLFDTARQATEAVNALRKNGFADYLINMVSGEGSSGSLDDIAKAIMNGWVLKHEAYVYAGSVQQGKSLVSIRAPFATGRRCGRIMDAFGPAESPVRPQREPLPKWDDAAPLSSALWWPVAVDSSAPFSATFGMATLAREAAPFSRLFCWTTKSKSPTPFSSMLGLPLLAKNPAPFSTMLGLRLLK